MQATTADGAVAPAAGGTPPEKVDEVLWPEAAAQGWRLVKTSATARWTYIALSGERLPNRLAALSQHYGVRLPEIADVEEDVPVQWDAAAAAAASDLLVSDDDERAYHEKRLRLFLEEAAKHFGTAEQREQARLTRTLRNIALRPRPTRALPPLSTPAHLRTSRCRRRAPCRRTRTSAPLSTPSCAK